MTIWQVADGQSIQAAIVGAADGDTIVVGAGVYTENLTIDKAVTIQGANAGIAGTGARDSATVIKGTTTVPAAGPVTIKWQSAAVRKAAPAIRRGVPRHASQGRQ